MTREREPRTFLCFLIEQMEGVDETRRRRSLKERLGLRGIGCCGANWGFGAATVRDDDEEEDEEESQRQEVVPDVGAAPLQRNSDPGCTDPVPRGSGMNLAAALAAERHFRASSEPEQPNEMAARAAGLNRMGTGTAPGTPLRVSLLRLLEETTESGGGTEATQKERGSGTVGGDSVCCVCMVRKKGAAFIPCGHTFCRVCSRELWLNRGSCPLCNRSILEILDIF